MYETLENGPNKHVRSVARIKHGFVKLVVILFSLNTRCDYVIPYNNNNNNNNNNNDNNNNNPYYYYDNINNKNNNNNNKNNNARCNNRDDVLHLTSL